MPSVPPGVGAHPSRAGMEPSSAERGIAERWREVGRSMFRAARPEPRIQRKSIPRTAIHDGINVTADADANTFARDPAPALGHSRTHAHCSTTRQTHPGVYIVAARVTERASAVKTAP